MITNNPEMRLSANNLSRLLVEGLEEAFWSGQLLLPMLPRLAKAACSPELTSTFDLHAAQTDEHMVRLKKIFRILGTRPQRTSTVMNRFLQEAHAVLEQPERDPVAGDLALIAVAKKMSTYQVALYDSLHSMALSSGFSEIAKLLKTIVGQEDERQLILAKLQKNFQAAAIRIGPSSGLAQGPDHTYLMA